MTQPLIPEDFKNAVKNTPLVSIDLVIWSSEGRVLFGFRKNEPAKDTFFVPGGRILKDETIEEAFCRITVKELNYRVKFKKARSLGVFEHFYPMTNTFGDSGFGTHYIVHAYEVTLDLDICCLPFGQHSKYEWMSPHQAKYHTGVHEFSKRYLEMNEIHKVEQYKIIANRRTATDTMLWQIPAMVFTAEAFLFQTITNKDVTSGFKLLISAFGTYIAFSSLQLLVKHRFYEENDSRSLEQFERANRNKGWGILHSRPRLRATSCEKCNANINEEPWRTLREASSFDIWKVLLSATLVVFAGLTVYWLKKCCSE